MQDSKPDNETRILWEAVETAPCQSPAFGKQCLAPPSEQSVFSFRLHLLWLVLTDQYSLSWKHLTASALDASTSVTQWLFQLKHFHTVTYLEGKINWK